MQACEVGLCGRGCLGSEGSRPRLWPFCTLTLIPRASHGHWATSTLPHLPGKKAPEADS